MKESLIKLIEQRQKEMIESARQPVIDKLEDALEINRELVNALVKISLERMFRHINWNDLESCRAVLDHVTEIAEAALAKGDSR